MPVDPFTWQDGERTIRFGRGALADATMLLDDGYTLLTTERAAASAPDVVARAGVVHHVGPGRVDELAGDLLQHVSGGLIVALGGGRVIDTAKSVAAAIPMPPTRVAAIPTTLSAAEMTRGHRQARGAPTVRFLRPAIVLNDPALCASQPEPSLAASAANALSHALEGPLTSRSSPVPTLAARQAADLIAAGFAGPEPDRDALALGALLSGYTIDSTSYGLHHVLSQTLVREADAGHGPVNAAILPHSLRALQRRFPDRVRDSDIATADCLADRTGTPRLRDQGIAHEQLPEAAELAAHRPDLDLTPPRADVAELLAIYEAAY